MSHSVPITRRTALLTLATVSAVSSACRPQPRPRSQLTFVLVHGASLFSGSVYRS